METVDGSLKQLGDGLWVAAGDFRMIGVNVGGRMSVLRLGKDRLALVSPMAPNDGLVGAVKHLGNVAYVIAPSLFHHLHVKPWLDAVAGAKLLSVPGLEKKRRDLHVDCEFSHQAPDELLEEVDLCPVRGMPMSREVLTFHKKSKSLLVTDLLFNLGEVEGAWDRLYFKLTRVYGGGLRSSVWMHMLTKDRPAAAASLLPMLAWDFERVVPCHGEIAEGATAREVQAALAWIGQAPVGG
jgi:hypothetical protein